MHKCAYMSTLCIRAQVAFPRARELPRASAFAGVRLVRLWETGMIRNVGSAAAVVGCSSAREDRESSASPLPCECQRPRQERKCVDAFARAGSAKIGRPCWFDEGLHSASAHLIAPEGFMPRP